MSAAVFLFDGDCAFCSRCAALLQRWVPTSAPVRAWQSADLSRLGLTARDCDRAVQWVEFGADGRRRASEGPAAIAELLRSSSRAPWRWTGRVLGFAPVRAAAGPVYRWVARHRDQMPGGTAACAIKIDDAVQIDDPL